MGSDGKEVLERMAALNLATPSDAANYRESLDVVDLLDGPIWHIIFRHLLLPPKDSTQLQNRGHFLGASEQGASSTSCGGTSQRTAREQHEQNTRRFGSSWPLLRCAMASKRLLEHITSFSELQPIALVHDTFKPKWASSIFWFLKQKGHRSVYLLFNSSKDLHSLGRLMASSAHSLTSLGLEIKEFADQGGKLRYKAGQLIYPAFLGTFEKLQRLKLGRGMWQLSNLNAAWFRDLRVLTIEHLDCNRNDHIFLSSIAPQLHEFSLSSTSRGTSNLNLEFAVARLISVSFERQVLNVCFSLPPSLKTFSLTAESLHVDCICYSPLSLKSIALVGYKQLSISLLPLASAKALYLNGPVINDVLHSPTFPDTLLLLTASQAPLAQLLSSVAPTVEVLAVRHGWPLESVDAEWSRLRRLGIGVNGRSARGFCCMTTVEDAIGPRLLNRNTSREAVTPPFINAPKLKSILLATRLWHPETLASLHRHFPSLTRYHIVGRSFCWKWERVRWNKEAVVEMSVDHGASAMKWGDMAQDDRMMVFVQCLM